MEVHVDEQNLIDIANAIRNKNGTQETYKPSQMSIAINNIPIGETKKITIDESVSYSQGNKIMSLITEVNNVDLSKNRYTSFGSLFDGCINLTKVENLNTTGVTFAFAMFRYCQSLIDVPELDMSASTDISSMFKSCVSLSDTSLNNILAMCTKAIAYTGTKDLKTIGLSSSQATKCESLSNYRAFIEAGWTTGY